MRDEPGTTAQTKLLTHSRLETLLLRAAPYLPLLSAILLLVGSWLTWVTLRIAFSIDGSPGNTFDMSIMGWSGVLQLIRQTPFFLLTRATLFLWDMFPLAGLLLCLLLTRQQRVARALLILYGAWLFITTVIVALTFAHALTMSATFSCTPDSPVCPEPKVLSRSIEVGGWLTLGSLALGWLALGLLVQRRKATVAITGLGASVMAQARYSSTHRLGAGVFTLGAVTWAFGLLAVPWATSGCTGLHLSLNHFVRGTCSGADGYDVLTAGLTTMGLSGVISWLMIEVAGVIGLFAVITVWLPRLKRATWVTALAWSLLAPLFFAAGVHGVQVTIAHPPQYVYGLPQQWEPSYGLAICALGIAVCWAGAALLARTEILHARQAKQIL